MRTLRTDLFEDEVYVFTPKGEVKTLPAGATPDRLRLRGPHRRRPPHRRREGERPDRAAPLPAEERRHRRDPHLEVGARAVARLAVAGAYVARPQQDPPVVPARDARARPSRRAASRSTRRSRRRTSRTASCRGRACSPQVIREMGFKKAEDFYIALGSGKLGAGQVVNKVMQRLKTDEVDAEPVDHGQAARRASAVVTGESLGIDVPGVEDVLVRLAKCCTPGARATTIVGYISLGRGITIHREDCPNVRALSGIPSGSRASSGRAADLRELPRPDRRRRLGSHAPARGRRAHVRRARREHRLLRRHGRGRDGAELVHGRGRRREGRSARSSPRSGTSTPSSTPTG